MDTLTKTLLIEVAKTVLRVLDKAAPSDKPAPPDQAQPTPWATANNAVAERGALPKAALPKPALLDPETAPAAVKDARAGSWDPLRGDVVRIWTGDRYECGKVDSVCRGTPRRIWVVVPRTGKRNKRFRVESDKAVVVGGSRGVA